MHGGALNVGADVLDNAAGVVGLLALVIYTQWSQWSLVACTFALQAGNPTPAYLGTSSRARW